jgi:hypothetical protein
MVDAQNDRLAIDDELLLAVLQSGFNDPGEALCPIVPAASDALYDPQANVPSGSRAAGWLA